MAVYSLGMTLYWTVDYHLPQNQPVRLSDSLNSLLLSMCEDVAHRRVNLLTLLETCQQHHKTAVLPRPQKAIRQMAEDVLQAERNPNDSAHLTDRSQMLRERLRGASCQNSFWPLKRNSTRSPADFSRSHSSHQRSRNMAWLSQSPVLDRRRHFNSRSDQLLGSSFSLNERKIKDTGPEFIQMLEEPLVDLELPNSIVSNKGRSRSNQRDLTVMMPNGQNILLKCDVKSRGADVFDMIVAHANLVEHFYFGLAYSDDNEFFFIDNDTKISKVAPGAWKKVPSATFVLHFRIRYFVNDVSVLLHKLTRHQYYLQLRRDILDDRLSCNEETCLFLGALALQAEFGDSMPEVWGKNYYQPEHYVSKSVLKKMAMPCLKEELLRLHANNANMSAEEAELEFLKRRKFIIESSTSKKKNIFLTEKSKVAKYLCDLCSAQHKFHKEMSSRQLTRSLASEESMVQYAAACRTQNNQLNGGRLNASMSRFCEDVASRIEAKIKQQRDLLDYTGSQSPAFQRSSCSSPKRCYEVPSMSSPLRVTPTSVRSPEREIICVSLKKDPKVGLGIVIVGEDHAGKLDLGIFIASIVPGGPADRDGRIKPGGRLISLNQLSLEGVSFSEAADIMQSSSNEVELIVSQPKALYKRGGAGHLAERNYESQSTILDDGRAGDDYLDELVSVMMTPKGTHRLHVPEVRIINAQDDYSRSASLISLRPEDFTVTLQKSGGSLGISIAGGVNTGLCYGGIYIKSLVPGGAAEQDGRIHTGDRLLEVDGTRLQGFTDQQAAECLASLSLSLSLYHGNYTLVPSLRNQL
uniref:FERM and PDZ domain containing 2 n=1 Tax=Cyprinus carpio TaxID=7962 RepID=A0A8C2KCS1_CYPCA